MAVAEAEPIGGFVGMAISEPLLQAGILLSVIGYMGWLEPWTLLSLGYLLPQALFVPTECSRRSTGGPPTRIKTLRRVSGDILESGTPDEQRIERVFALNMGIYKLKFVKNLGYPTDVRLRRGGGAWAPAAGSLFTGRIDVGTVVAVVSRGWASSRIRGATW